MKELLQNAFPPNSRGLRTIISTGLGRLHLVGAAAAIQGTGIKVRIIQGWTPRRVPACFLDLAGRLLGLRHLSVGLAKRRPEGFGDGTFCSCPTAEFLTQGMFLLARKGLVSRSKMAALGWRTFGRASRRYLRNADIFHVRSGAGQGGAIRKAKGEGMKVVVDHSIAHPAFMENALKLEYEEFGKTFELGPSAPLWRLVLQDCCEADCLQVNSDFVKETFVRQGYPVEKIRVIYLGVRHDFVMIKRNYRRAKRLKLLYTGGFSLRKGARYLLRSLQLIEEQGIEYELVVAGSPDEASFLLTRFPIKSQVRFLGYIPQDDLKDLLSTADIYVFPSLAEGCASSCMEALAAGLPVLTTRESGAPIEHGREGWIVPSKDPEALASAIDRLASDEGLRAALGQAGAELIKNKLTWQHYGRNVRALYQELLAGKQVSGQRTNTFPRA